MQDSHVVRRIMSISIYSHVGPICCKKDNVYNHIRLTCCKKDNVYSHVGLTSQQAQFLAISNPTGTHFEHRPSHELVEPWSDDLGPWWSADLDHLVQSNPFHVCVCVFSELNQILCGCLTSIMATICWCRSWVVVGVMVMTVWFWLCVSLIWLPELKLWW